MERGSLWDLIKAGKLRRAPWKLRVRRAPPFCCSLTAFFLQDSALPCGRPQVQMLLDVANGLSHIHRHGVAHRDLKSPNCLVDIHGAWRRRQHVRR